MSLKVLIRWNRRSVTRMLVVYCCTCNKYLPGKHTPWQGDTLCEISHGGRAILCVKYSTLGGWYFKWNIPGWESDILYEISQDILCVISHDGKVIFMSNISQWEGNVLYEISQDMKVIFMWNISRWKGDTICEISQDGKVIFYVELFRWYISNCDCLNQGRDWYWKLVNLANY